MRVLEPFEIVPATDVPGCQLRVSVQQAMTVQAWRTYRMVKALRTVPQIACPVSACLNNIAKGDRRLNVLTKESRDLQMVSNFE